MNKPSVSCQGEEELPGRGGRLPCTYVGSLCSCSQSRSMVFLVVEPFWSLPCTSAFFLGFPHFQLKLQLFIALLGPLLLTRLLSDFQMFSLSSLSLLVLLSPAGLKLFKNSHKYHFLGTLGGGKLHICVQSSVLNPKFLKIFVFIFSVFTSVFQILKCILQIFMKTDSFSSPAMSFFSGPW